MSLNVTLIQVQGEQSRLLQGQCDGLQNQLDCLQAEHAKASLPQQYLLVSPTSTVKTDLMLDC